jgi:cytochrome c-type biogenesis protein CcmH
MMLRFIIVLMLVWFGAGTAQAVDDPHEMLANPVLEQKAEQIGRQLRCLVCQNEDIEDSGADLAKDLRRIVRVQVSEGRSQRQIMDWMTARYGNFVRLAPPLVPATVLLWGMPVAALLLGFGVAGWAVVRRGRGAVAPAPLTEAERTRLAEITSRS